MNEAHTEDYPLALPYEVSEALIPGWWVWRSPIGGQWHARKRGTDKPVVEQWDDLEGLREKCREQS